MVKTKKFKSDLSNYATKSDLNSAIGIDSSEFAKKVDLASLKSDVGNLDIGKLQTIFVSKLSNVVKNDVIKKIVYGELVKKVSDIQTIDTSDLVKKADYDSKIEDIERQIAIH